jgi:hypothetical protein
MMWHDLVAQIPIQFSNSRRSQRSAARGFVFGHPGMARIPFSFSLGHEGMERREAPGRIAALDAAG